MRRVSRSLATWARIALVLICVAAVAPTWACSRAVGKSVPEPRPGEFFARAQLAFIGHVIEVGPPQDWEGGPRTIRMHVDHWLKGSGAEVLALIDPAHVPCGVMSHIGDDARPDRHERAWTVFVEQTDGRNLITYWSDRRLEVGKLLLSEDGTRLVMQMSDGVAVAAPYTLADQVGFSDAKISPDGRYAGWTAQMPNCCASYPLPVELVVHDGLRVVRIVGPTAPPIFAWAFAADGATLILRQEFPHGDGPRFLSQVRLSDGKLLASFQCNAYRPEGPKCKSAPAWARTLALSDDEDGE